MCDDLAGTSRFLELWGKGSTESICESCRGYWSERKVYMLVSKAQMENAKNQLGNVSGVTLLECETDDAWARDVGATMVLDEKGAVCGVDWQFNAWGGTFDGLYRNWERMTGWLPLSAGLSVVHVWMPDLLCWRAVPSILTERGL